MLDATKQFHETGHVHRDIKPDNFRVDDEEVYIVDFGTIKNIIKNDGSFSNVE